MKNEPPTKYRVKWALYPLREHERALGLWELRALFPGAKVEADADGGRLSLQSPDPGAHEKLRRLSFFSAFQSGEGGWTHTEQREIELADGGTAQGRNIRYFLHSLHEYKGRYYPQLCKALINITSGGEGKVLDPFCGCGTTIYESAMIGMPAVGVDINPIGAMIARAKIAGIGASAQSIEQAFDVFDKFPAVANISINSGNNMDYLQRWIPEKNLHQLLCIDRTIDKTFTGEFAIFLKALLSSVIRHFSFQAPGEQRIRRRTDTPPDNVFDEFQKKLFTHLHKAAKLADIIGKKRKNTAARIYVGDSRSIPMKRATIDAVVCSPPYATALPYIDADRLSLFFFGFVNQRSEFASLEKNSIGNREISISERNALGDYAFGADSGDRAAALPREVVKFLAAIKKANDNSSAGFRRKNLPMLLYKYFIGMRDSMIDIRRVVKPGGKIAMVVGDNFTVAAGQRVDIPTADFINLIARDFCGLNLVRTIDTTVPKAYNIYSKNAMKKESIAVFEKES